MARRASTRSAPIHTGPQLTPEQLAAIGEPGRFKFVRADGLLVWQSQAGMQTTFFDLSPHCDEILLGGKRKLGKTDALIAWLAEPMQYPDYRALLVRVSQEALKETIDRAWQMLQPLGFQMHRRPEEFHGPMGSIIYTAHFSDARSFEALKGHMYSRIGVEEASQIPNKDLYLKLLSSVGTRVPGFRPALCCTSNPDGPLNDFLKRRFIKVWIPDGKGMLRQVEPGERFMDPTEKKIRVYITGGIDENRIFLKDNPSYYEGLRNLQPHLYKAWVHGDWDAPESAFYPEFRRYGPVIGEDGKLEPPEACHVIPSKPLPYWCHRWAAMDWAYGHHLAIGWGAIGPDRRIHVYRELVARKMGTDVAGAEFAKLTAQELRENPDLQMTVYVPQDVMGAHEGPKTIAEQFVEGAMRILGPNSVFLLYFTEQEREIARKNQDEAFGLMNRRLEEVGENVRIVVRRVNNNRPTGWSYLRTLLRWKPLRSPLTPDPAYTRQLIAKGGALAAEAYLDMFREESEVLPKIVLHDCCPQTIESIPKACADPNRMDDVRKWEGDDEGPGDDPLDMLRYLAMGYKEYEVQKPYPVWFNEQMQQYTDESTDINLRIQVARYQEAKWKTTQHSLPITLPRASVFGGSYDL